MAIDFNVLAEEAGIHFMGVDYPELLAPNARLRKTWDGKFACDAQPSLVTVSNAGIPSYLSTIFDPKIIDILTTPMKAAQIAGRETKKGDWTTQTQTFLIAESTGEVSSYDDFSNSGQAGVNLNFPNRQSYHYQLVTQWGEKQLDTAGLARVNYANQLNVATVLTLNKYQNGTYFYGVSGLQLYGILNDPSLYAPITPTTKTAGGTSWENADALEMLADVTKLYGQLQTQAPGLVDLETPMTLAMSPQSQKWTTKTTIYNVNFSDILVKNYPNLTIKTAPEYSTVAGELLQLIANGPDGQVTMEVAFTEKLRAHPIVNHGTWWEQKKSQGTWGAIIYRPMFISQMLGV